jgi:hypothetical protein
VGLSIINRIHNLTGADWDKIPEHRGRQGIPTFDYSYIASDGENIIQVETKGSSVYDNRALSNNIYQHKSDIKRKKRQIENLEFNNSYPYPSHLRYGAISAIDMRMGGEIACWLLDPPFENRKYLPTKIKLINRMNFLRDWIAFLSPQSQIVTALSTRFKSLISLQDPFELDKIPLSKRYGIPFEYDFERNSHVGWFQNKSYVVDGPHTGVVLNLSPERFFFLGFRNEFIKMAINQDFNQIMKYETSTGRVFKKVNCIASNKLYKSFQKSKFLEEIVRKKNDYYHFTLSGDLYLSPGGLVFGELPLM